MERRLSLRDAAARLGVSVFWARLQVRRGRLVAVRDGRRLLVPEWAIDDYCRRVEAEQGVEREPRLAAQEHIVGYATGATAAPLARRRLIEIVAPPRQRGGHAIR